MLNDALDTIREAAHGEDPQERVSTHSSGRSSVRSPTRYHLRSMNGRMPSVEPARIGAVFGQSHGHEGNHRVRATGRAFLPARVPGGVR